MGQSKPITPSQKAEQNLHELLHKFDNAMLVTHADRGSHARPMAVAQVGDDGSVWFITRSDSPKVDEISQDREVVAAFQSSRIWLSVTGRAELNRDRALIDKVWKQSFEPWFENGKDDPNIALIRLIPSAAEYWDNTGTSGVRFALKVAAAYVSGKTVKGPGDVDQHAKVQL